MSKKAIWSPLNVQYGLLQYSSSFFIYIYICIGNLRFQKTKQKLSDATLFNQGGIFTYCVLLFLLKLLFFLQKAFLFYHDYVMAFRRSCEAHNVALNYMLFSLLCLGKWWNKRGNVTVLYFHKEQHTVHHNNITAKNTYIKDQLWLTSTEQGLTWIFEFGTLTNKKRTRYSSSYINQERGDSIRFKTASSEYCK